MARAPPPRKRAKSRPIEIVLKTVAFAPMTQTTFMASATAQQAPERPNVRRVRLFGQFLVDEGIIDTTALGDALALMTALNSTLGELAVEHGFITETDAEEINRLQRRIDGRWGDIAIELGFGKLTPQQLERLRDEQDARNLRLTDAIVELGFASATEMDELYARYEEACGGDGPTTGLPDGYAESALVGACVDVLPRVLRRVLRTPVRLSRPRLVEHPEGLDAHVGATLKTDVTLNLALSVCPSLAAATTSLLGPANDPTDVESAQRRALGELFIAFVAQVQQKLGSTLCEASNLVHGVLPAHGVMFDLALGLGEGVLVIQRDASLEQER